MNGHAWIEWDEGWFDLIVALGFGVILALLVLGCLGLYRLKENMRRNRT